jgi:hypothetical protein
VLHHHACHPTVGRNIHAAGAADAGVIGQRWLN